MQLIIDQGNTSLKAGWFRGEKLVRAETYSRVEELNTLLVQDVPDRIGIGSVAAKGEEIKNKLQTTAKSYVIDNTWPTPLVTKYATPTTLGIDRIAAAVGAWTLHPLSNLLVIDLGTCITYDLVDETGTYHGGNITPGLHMRFEAMHHYTARLPNPGVNWDISLVGNSTPTSLQSGVLYGIIGEMEGMISRYRHLFNPLRVCLTGGDAPFFESKVKESIFVVRNLVLIGLNTILTQHAE
ncbi:MAG TPA: pantothenate kinase [Cytophagales bacterium]|nr:pantothenate kinase [Cytophagales bacterium]HAA23384.1 pantothenate kinase [Cytophagales bacterium]HAP58136.1 pantothenate kinase [Cytophagales bacterium]